MNLSDPIADFLTRIRNACNVGHRTVVIPHSKMKEAIAKILKEEGYIIDVVSEGEVPNKQLTVYLKYDADEISVIRGLQKISKPGLRRYVPATEIPRVLGGLGIAVLSTSRGITTGQKARRDNIGGEVLCEIW